MIDSQRAGRRSTLILWLAVGIGVGVLWRVVRYAMNLQLHGDDAFLLTNVLVKGWGDLLMPLANNQVAPPVFLWIEKLSIDLIPYDYGTRIFPFFAGLVSLGLMIELSRQMLRGSARWLAIGIFSVTHTVVTLSVRAKPYSTDLLVGLLLTYLALLYIKHPRRAALIVAMAFIGAVAMWSSYTSLFVASGIGLVLAAYILQRHRSISVWPVAALAFYAFATVGSLLFLYVIVVRFNVVASESNGLAAFWGEEFPPATMNPFKLAYWALDIHTGMMYAYPAGAQHFGCTGQLILWILGVRGLWLKSNRWWVWLLVAPQLMLLVGAIMRIYPYGGNPRICLFLAPSMCIFIAVGIVEISTLFKRVGRRRTIWIGGTVVALAGVGGIAWDLIDTLVFKPEPTIRTLLTRVSDECGPDDVVVCLNPQRILYLGGLRQMFEYYMIRAVHHPIHWNGKWSLDPRHPNRRLYLVVFRDEGAPDPHDLVEQWVRATLGPGVRSPTPSRSALMRGAPGQLYVYEYRLPEGGKRGQAF